MTHFAGDDDEAFLNEPAILDRLLGLGKGIPASACGKVRKDARDTCIILTKMKRRLCLQL